MACKKSWVVHKNMPLRVSKWPHFGAFLVFSSKSLTTMMSFCHQIRVIFQHFPGFEFECCREALNQQQENVGYQKLSASFWGSFEITFVKQLLTFLVGFSVNIWKERELQVVSEHPYVPKNQKYFWSLGFKLLETILSPLSKFTEVVGLISPP